MNISERINKLFECDQIYEQLKEDPTVYLLFGLCKYHVIKDLVKEAKQFLKDLRMGIIHEIPDYDLDAIEKFKNRLKSSKFKNDMKELAKNNEKIIVLLYKEYKDICDPRLNELPIEIAEDKLAKILLLKNIVSGIKEKDPDIFENCFRPFMKRSYSFEESLVLEN